MLDLYTIHLRSLNNRIHAQLQPQSQPLNPLIPLCPWSPPLSTFDGVALMRLACTTKTSRSRQPPFKVVGFHVEIEHNVGPYVLWGDTTQGCDGVRWWLGWIVAPGETNQNDNSFITSNQVCCIPLYIFAQDLQFPVK